MESGGTGQPTAEEAAEPFSRAATQAADEDSGHGHVLRPTPFAGAPDAFQRLWTPYRMAYINGDQKPRGDACPFCEAPALADDEALIVHRGQSCFVILNLFPYNSGHLLVCPYRHVADYADLTEGERGELGDLTAQAMRVTRAVAGPDGFNLGMNQGELAGAGIAGHLHQHVVPRWAGDANFFPIIAQTKALPELLGDARSKLARAWTLSVIPATGDDDADTDGALADSVRADNAGQNSKKDV